MARAAVALTLFPRARVSGLLDLTTFALVLRGRAPAAGFYSLPGGRVHEGETLAAAALREAQEELGVVAAPLFPHGPLVPAFAATDAMGLFSIAHVLGWVWARSDGRPPPLTAGDDAKEALWARVPWHGAPPPAAGAGGLPWASSLSLAGPVLEVVRLAQTLASHLPAHKLE
jgi:8-oxo-dGTP pyrophosphatase MutT (NUDIX family)